MLLTASDIATLGGCKEQGRQALREGFDGNFRSPFITWEKGPEVSQEGTERLCDCALEEINSRYSRMEKGVLSDDELTPTISAWADKVVTQ